MMMVVIRRVAVSLPVSLCLLLTPGCSRDSSQTSSEETQTDVARQKMITGVWTTSTSPEMAHAAWKLTFLESGEHHVSGPLMIGGVPVNLEVDGEKELASFNGSGTWKLNGDDLEIVINTSNLPGFESKPTTSKVLELTENKLSLQEGSEVRVYFRVKDPDREKGPG